MHIPLPKMMRHWREKEFEQHLQPKAARAGLGLWAFAARRPKLYRTLVSLAMPLLAAMAGGKRRFASLPLAGSWTKWRDLPAPEGRTFLQQYRQGERPAVSARGTAIPKPRRSIAAAKSAAAKVDRAAVAKAAGTGAPA